MSKRTMPAVKGALLEMAPRVIAMLIAVVVLGGAIGLTVYSFKRCGWGMFAYEYPLIAALTQECAQQQRLLN